MIADRMALSVYYSDCGWAGVQNDGEQQQIDELAHRSLPVETDNTPPAFTGSGPTDTRRGTSSLTLRAAPFPRLSVLQNTGAPGPRPSTGTALVADHPRLSLLRRLNGFLRRLFRRDNN